MSTTPENGEHHEGPPRLNVTGVAAPVLAKSADWPLVDAQPQPTPTSTPPVAISRPAAASTDRPRRAAAGEFAFDSQNFLRPDVPLPAPGWRGAVQRATHGIIRPKLNARQKYEAAVLERIGARISSCQRVAFASAKGGVGKTTASVLCGHALAMHRLDRIVALDANPDAGSLGYRVTRETESTLSDLLRHADQIQRYSDVRALTSQAPSRLEVLASENDPAISHALGESDFRRAITVLERFYSVILCDLGTGLLDSATQGIFKLSNQIIIITAPSVDAGRVADFTLDFVERRDPRKARDAVVLINNVRHDSLVDVKGLARHFRRRVRSVVSIPYDRHLATGGLPEWQRLKPRTQRAYLDAAAVIADGFVQSRPQA